MAVSATTPVASRAAAGVSAGALSAYARRLGRITAAGMGLALVGMLLIGLAIPVLWLLPVDRL